MSPSAEIPVRVSLTVLTFTSVELPFVKTYFATGVIVITPVVLSIIKVPDGAGEAKLTETPAPTGVVTAPEQAKPVVGLKPVVDVQPAGRVVVVVVVVVVP